MTILSSRKQTCMYKEVRELNGMKQKNLCEFKVRENQCSYRNKTVHYQEKKKKDS